MTAPFPPEPGQPPRDDLASIRRRFVLDPDVIFLNHGSFGACPDTVLAKQSALRLELEREPVRFFNETYEPLLDAARHALAAFVHADAEGVAFVQSATHGVNTVLRALTFEPGDELLTTDQEYNACKNALDYVAQRSGAKVVVAKVPFPITSPDVAVDAILRCVTPKTRLALLDHVTSPTALVFPIATLVRELRDRHVDTLVDGAHAIGMLPLDLEALGAAYYTSNCHKWLCAPKGSAFLYVREDRRDRIVPLSISHGANATRKDRSRFRLLFDWTGTGDASPFLAVPEAITFMNSVLPGGAVALGERNRALVLWGRALVCETLGIPLPAPDTMIGSIASIPLPPGPPRSDPSVFAPDPLQKALMDRHRIEIPVFPWPAGGRTVRLSAQAYNQPEDYERLSVALRELV